MYNYNIPGKPKTQYFLVIMGKSRSELFFGKILLLPVMTKKNCQIKRTLQSYP